MHASSKSFKNIRNIQNIENIKYTKKENLTFSTLFTFLPNSGEL